MLLALDTAVSGMKAHQDQMDIVGNNISNVNTTGFKAGRQTFAETLSQTLSDATRPETRGGTNPKQIGLGTIAGSTDTLFTQGNFQATGQTTDLAIEGSSFFQVGDGQGTYYTRNGAFQLDAMGHLVMPGSGLVLQGRNAEPDGEIPGSAVIEAIRVPLDMQSPARATSEIDFGRNLDADSAAQGSVVVSEPFLKYAGLSDEPIEGLLNSRGESLGLVPGTTLTFSASSGGVEFKARYKIAEGDTFFTLRTRFTDFLRRIDPAASAGRQPYPYVNTMGAMTVNAGPMTIENLQISSDNSAFSSRVASAFRYPTPLGRFGRPSAYFYSEPLRIGTRPDHLLRDTYDAKGEPFAKSLEAGDRITVSAMVGGEHIGGSRSLVYDPGATTMQNLLDLIRDEIGLAPTLGDGTTRKSAEVDPAGSQDNIADGAIVLRSLAGTPFAISNVVISASDSNGLTPKPLTFNGNSIFHQIQAARDSAVVDTAITAYDDQGYEHDLAVSFTHSDVKDQWLWEVKTGADEKIVSGGRGRITFGPDGTVYSFAFADDSAVLTIDPGHGAGIMRIKLDPGGPGRFDGLTQYRSDSTAAALGQDGHSSGMLKSLEIGQDGLITGLFTSGSRRSLAQLVVADFSNPGGLMHRSGSVFETTPNSGDPILGTPSQGASSTIKSGVLEMSNVDLAEQFTTMITSQRGYQANARVLTQADRFIEELVNLAR